MVEQRANNAKEDMNHDSYTQTTLKYNLYKNQSSYEHARAHSLSFPEKTCPETKPP